MYHVVVYAGVNITYMFDVHVYVELHSGYTLDDTVRYFLKTGPPGRAALYYQSYMALIDYELPTYNGKAMEPVARAVWNCYTLEHWVGNDIPMRFRNLPVI
ncbi:MAG: hypothetical protein P4L69_05160 [Desulfosporosinus sp.]|nr:hypothetical protein [Desulfosporosinus sp.]